MQRGDSVRRYDVARRSWVASLERRSLETPAVNSRDGVVRSSSPQFELEPVLDELPKEHLVTLEINGRPVANLLCSPTDLRELGAGWVFAHGFARTAGEIRSVTTRERRVSVMIDAPGPGGAAWQVLAGYGFDIGHLCRDELDEIGLACFDRTSDRERLSLAPATLLAFVHHVFEVARQSNVAAGLHLAASVGRDGTAVVMYDLSRHCAVDKVIGHSLLKRPNGEAHVLVVSGRVSADIVFKAWRAGLCLIATRSVPTGEAVRIANSAGITVVGRALDPRRAVYTNPWRLEATAERPHM